MQGGAFEVMRSDIGRISSREFNCVGCMSRRAENVPDLSWPGQRMKIGGRRGTHGGSRGLARSGVFAFLGSLEARPGCIAQGLAAFGTSREYPGAVYGTAGAIVRGA